MKVYIAIDLKSFYASVECRERGLDPLKTNLVVADSGRTEKTICLAVTPSLKAYGIPGRARLFEVIQRINEVNELRRLSAPGKKFAGESINADEINGNPSLSIGYIAATPRMSLYMEYSTRIYNIYLKYIAPEDIHVYSVDEVFIDLTGYLKIYGLDKRAFTKKLIQEVFDVTGITATAGIGTNLYLCKVAMDIWAKHTEPDEDGVRIAELDEMSYRKYLWAHQPLTDFWRVGRGYAKKLKEYGMFTMGDIARCSIGKENDYCNEDLLYRLFGVNAELLIDHAWGYEPCTIAQIKAYKPQTNSLSSGQVLSCPYEADKARIIVKEMTDMLVLDLVEKGLVTSKIVLNIGYDVDNLSDSVRAKRYKGPVTMDAYGRNVPKPAHGTTNISSKTSSSRTIIDAVSGLYDSIVDYSLLIRRINVTVCDVVPEAEAGKAGIGEYEQLSLFIDYEERDRKNKHKEEELKKEKKMQMAMLEIKKKFGKNAVIRGTDLEEGATMIERNRQIGGHKA